jgi:hypothetical protein
VLGLAVAFVAGAVVGVGGGYVALAWYFARVAERNGW